MTDAPLLPTPTVQDGANTAGPSQAARNTPPLNSVAVQLMPTPKASDGPNGGPGMRNGRGDADALPGIVHLLPTPAVNDMGEGKAIEQWDEWAARQKAADGRPAPHGKSLAIEAQRLMPTPSAADGMGGHRTRSGDRSDELLLPGVALSLMPTPTAMDSVSSSGSNPDWGHGTTLTDAARESVTDFGPYTPAVRRWEHSLGRPAPSPTEPGRDRPRLSPAFVEWLMGLPAGWVTDTGIPRSAQLKALGNGIVPQQAAHALRLLLAMGDA